MVAQVLSVVGGGVHEGEVIASDIEQHPYLKEQARRRDRAPRPPPLTQLRSLLTTRRAVRQESLWCARALAASEAEVAKRKEEKAELEEAVKELSSTIQGGMQKAADDMLAMAAMHKQESAPRLAQRRASEVQDDEWDDDGWDDAPTPTAPSGPSAAQMASAEKAREDELKDLETKAAQLEAFERAIKELDVKMATQQGQVDANRDRLREWEARVAACSGAQRERVPVFPVGDAILEPFWPQGLGSNRGEPSRHLGGISAASRRHLGISSQASTRRLTLSGRCTCSPTKVSRRRCSSVTSGTISCCRRATPHVAHTRARASRAAALRVRRTRSLLPMCVAGPVEAAAAQASQGLVG